MKIKIARKDMHLLDMSSIYGQDDGVEAFVIPTEGDPVEIETHDAARFSRWRQALEKAGRTFEIIYAGEK